MELMEHQQRIVEHCLNRKGTLVTADIGTGKTAIAIHCIDPLGTNLVVVPPSLKANWKQEFELWKPGLTVNTDNLEPIPGEVTLIGYSQLAKVNTKGWDVVIFDEAHYLKNPNSKRTEYADPIIRYANKRQVLMTATPVLNNIEECRFLLLLLGAPDVPYGAKDLYEYGYSQGWMIRVKKSDVLDIDDAMFHQIDVGLSSQEEINEIVSKIKGLVESGETFEDTVKENRALLSGHIASLRKAVGTAKVADTIEKLHEYVSNGDDPIVVFGHHRNVLEHIGRAFDAPILYGGVPMKRRHEIVQEFQDGKHRMVVCSMASAGLGLTLTRSSKVVFVEYPWVPAEYDQAYGRVHRKTQERQVKVVDMVADHRIDKRHVELLREKREVAGLVVDGDRGATSWKMQKALIRDLVEI